MNELNEDIEMKEQMLRIKEKAKVDESQAYEEMMGTVIGEIQKEFLISLKKEIDKTSTFYMQLTKNIIREVNSILKNRDQWM